MNFSELAPVTFAYTDADEIVNACVEYLEQTLDRKLARADPLVLLIKAFAVNQIQMTELINDLAKQNLLAYARDEVLDHIGILVGCTRLEAQKAQVTVEVTLSAPREKVTTISAGTRINAGDNINFALDEAVIFLVGETVKSAKASCVEVGEIGNGYKIGELNRIVDPQPFLLSIANLTVSEGGADAEDDDTFRERIRLAPESFSTAGPGGAYEFFAKEVSPLITDVFAISENPGEVSIYPLLKGGELPDTELLEKLIEHLSDRTLRPLTDKVFVKKPLTEGYDIVLRYWIARSDSAFAASIQAKATQAIDDFILWQKSKLGRDLNPTELYWRLRSAGVKRAEILSPQFKIVDERTIAVVQNITANYAGLEDD